MQITEPFIQYWARGQQSSEKGRSLSGGFAGLYTSDDGLCIWADYPGSDNSLYQTQVDLRDDASPRFSCSCPSRQNPCKHALALLWARSLSPEDFSVDNPPEMHAPSSRKSKAAQPTPLAQRGQALTAVRQMLASLLGEGLDAQTPALIRQKKKQLQGLHVLPGVRYALLGILSDLADSAHLRADILGRITTLCALIERAGSQPGTADNGQAAPPDWELDTLLGRVWRFEDLKTLGYIRYNVNLIQLAFWSEDDTNARRYTDMALWADASTAQIYETHHYRPYEAARHIPPEDSSHAMLCAGSMVFYPGTDRVRWNACRPGPVTTEACRDLCAAAFGSIAEAMGYAADKINAHKSYPAALLRFQDMGYSGQVLFVRDTSNMAYPLHIPPSSADVLKSVYSENYSTILLRFSYNAATGLCAKPLALLSEERIRRL